MKAFADCIHLGVTEIPMSVSNIHETAFDGCVNLKIAAEAGSVAAEYDAQRDKSNVANAEYQDILPNRPQRIRERHLFQACTARKGIVRYYFHITSKIYFF